MLDVVEVAVTGVTDRERRSGKMYRTSFRGRHSRASACLRVRPSVLPAWRLGPTLRLTWRRPTHQMPYHALRYSATRSHGGGAGCRCSASMTPGIVPEALPGRPFTPGRRTGRYHAQSTPTRHRSRPRGSDRSARAESSECGLAGSAPRSIPCPFQASRRLRLPSTTCAWTHHRRRPQASMLGCWSCRRCPRHRPAWALSGVSTPELAAPEMSCHAGDSRPRDQVGPSSSSAD